MTLDFKKRRYETAGIRITQKSSDTVCAFKVKETLNRVAAANRLLNAGYVVNVNNVDFNEQSQGKQKLVSGHLRYRISIACRVDSDISRTIFYGKDLADKYRLTSFPCAIRSEPRQEAVRMPLTNTIATDK